MSDRSKSLKVEDFEGNDKWGQLPWDLLETIFGVWTGEGQLSYRFTTLRLVNQHWKCLADKLVKKIRPASTSSMENVGLVLDTMPEIRKVDFSWRCFDDDQAMGLARGLRSREGLIEVDMTGCALPGITWSWLMEALGSCPNLECINSGSCWQGDSAIGMLSDVLENHSRLTKLELSGGATAINCKKQNFAFVYFGGLWIMCALVVMVAAPAEAEENRRASPRE
ncbi:hypothetical protein BSKO_11975 [Bryopsis sp. KO-2023]|nr:hypothetical protein BSKO_11975 [Bryopsis sp. KO-2023]